eukprot:TRINITY_DN12697_c0_g2_i1.p2 TRINITY_DN12697_c0_g2~~TRINITY_DN12697_c0_g2_i1.p2  ORF type:complete len:106 (+),score=4.81 TRINITY_DN12697_c0_g2_i1:43-360(+)
MPEDVNAELRVVGSCIEEIITPSLAYQHEKVGGWVNSVVESCMRALTELKMPRKYIVHCTVLQKSGAGLYSNTACYWDSSSDGYFTHRTENSTLICVTTVYGIAL